MLFYAFLCFSMLFYAFLCFSMLFYAFLCFFILVCRYRSNYALGESLIAPGKRIKKYDENMMKI